MGVSALPWKVRRLQLSNLVGYRHIEWAGIDPELNFLVGRNGAGKSTILKAIVSGLTYVSGRHSEDLFLRTYGDASILIEFQDGSTQTFSFGHVRVAQGDHRKQPDMRILQIVENRLPKNVVGKYRLNPRSHPSERYQHALSELRHLLTSKKPEEQEMGHTAIEICKSTPELGKPEQWQWLADELVGRAQTKARPASCGQFDIVAFILDILHFVKTLKSDTAPVFVVIDNPETYLHPACQEPLLGLVHRYLPTAQVFVASHSVKLLCGRKPKTVFWLSRERADAEGQVRIESVRELDDGSRSAFFELYGVDVNSAVVRLLSELEAPDYYRFLCECALECQPVARPEPGADRQLERVADEISQTDRPLTLLDVGAGFGDLLTGLIRSGRAGPGLAYYAHDPYTSPELGRRVDDAKAAEKINAASSVLPTLDAAPHDCDVIVLCNVCHALPVHTLADTLATLLANHLRRNPPSRLLVTEIAAPTIGESNCIVWQTCDYKRMFGSVSSVNVASVKLAEQPSGSPFEMIAISISECEVVLDKDTLSQKIEENIWGYLPEKRLDLIGELRRLWDVRGDRGLEKALRQRRVAFLTAQIAALFAAETGRNKAPAS
ncbi:MAG: AAA family ATPase [Acidobacteriia bacterium]|nr:AAA family ATPase [Terriglobia bacterium]